MAFHCGWVGVFAERASLRMGGGALGEHALPFVGGPTCWGYLLRLPVVGGMLRS